MKKKSEIKRIKEKMQGTEPGTEEYSKLQEQLEKAKKNRHENVAVYVPAVATVFAAGVTLVTTVLGIKAKQRNLQAVQRFEQDGIPMNLSTKSIQQDSLK